MLIGQYPLTGHLALPAPRRRLPFSAAALALLAALAGCTGTDTRAPVVDMTSPGGATAAPAASAGGTYVVKPGDSLYQIARATGTDVAALARWNNLTDPGQLRIGQVLRLSEPEGQAGAPAAPSAPPAGGAQSLPVPVPKPVQPKPADGQPPVGPAVPSAPPATATPSTPPRAADAGLITWGWPASGPILKAFGPGNKGLDFAGKIGDPVYAAADGMVKYSGPVKDLGNLVIIEHQGGFLTAYAHNSKLLVQAGQANVRRGTKIAEIGQSDTTSPRLHFELRRKGEPLDPLQYLPPR